jgi:hypothetical protein
MFVSKATVQLWSHTDPQNWKIEFTLPNDVNSFKTIIKCLL